MISLLGCSQLPDLLHTGRMRLLLTVAAANTIWLSKDDPDYLRMKVKARNLKKLLEENLKDTVEVTKFLWSIGYEEGINRGSVYGAIVLGTRVPNYQLYWRMKAFITGKYHIEFNEEFKVDDEE